MIRGRRKKEGESPYGTGRVVAFSSSVLPILNDASSQLLHESATGYHTCPDYKVKAIKAALAHFGMIKAEDLSERSLLCE